MVYLLRSVLNRDYYSDQLLRGAETFANSVDVFRSNLRLGFPLASVRLGAAGLREQANAISALLQSGAADGRVVQQWIQTVDTLNRLLDDAAVRLAASVGSPRAAPGFGGMSTASATAALLDATDRASAQCDALVAGYALFVFYSPLVPKLQAEVQNLRNSLAIFRSGVARGALRFELNERLNQTNQDLVARQRRLEAVGLRHAIDECAGHERPGLRHAGVEPTLRLRQLTEHYRFFEKGIAMCAGTCFGMLAIALSSPLAAAQEAGQAGAAATTTRPMSAAEKKFADTLVAAQTAIRQSKTFKVEAESNWQSEGPSGRATGKNYVRWLVQYPAKFRLEVWSEAQPNARLTVVSDEQTVTRWMAATNAYSQSRGGDPWNCALQEDALTAQTMEAAGADFLIRADLQGFLSTRLVRVEDLGTQSADNRTFRCFQLALANGREVVARIVEGEAMLPVELLTSFLVPISEQSSFRMSIETKLKWTFNEAFPDQTFVLSLPAGAQRVGDLMDSMLGDDSKETVGQAAPELSFVGLDEKPVSLAEYRNKAIVVLYFWASWAAPSTDRMPDLNKFVQDFSKLGVQFLAVNVGEHPADAKAFVEKLGYRGRVVRDPQALAMAALRISELPAVAVVAKDGTRSASRRRRRARIAGQGQDNRSKRSSRVVNLGGRTSDHSLPFRTTPARQAFPLIGAQARRRPASRRAARLTAKIFLGMSR